MTPLLTLEVFGEPKGAGSKTPFMHKQTGIMGVKDSSGKKGAQWREDVKAAALIAYKGVPLLDQLRVDVIFVRMRPTSHWRASGALRDKLIDAKPGTRPDATKLWRAVEDALTGLVWKDDSQITDQRVRKVYGDRPGVIVRVWPDSGPNGVDLST